MNFEFSDEQEQLRATVRRFLADHAPIASFVRPMLDDPRGTTTDVWAGLAALGATGLLVPEELGGVGMGMTDMAVVLEELGRAVHPGPLLTSAVVAASAVLAAGSAEDHADLLPTIAAGSRVATLALFEPGRRWDWTAPATSADARMRLTGEKAHVDAGATADVLLVLASDAAGAGLYAIDAGAAGLTTEPVVSVDGTHKPATIRLDGCAARRLGDESRDAREVLAAVVDRAAVAVCLDGLGAADEALRRAVAYAGERVQFDQPIGAFQAVQHLCADMLHAVELARAGAYYAAWAVDAASPEEAHRAATMAKAYASDAFPRVGATAIQVFGGVGFTWEDDIHLFYKRLLWAANAYGDAGTHLEHLAALVVD